jgi:hypothetical protein
VFVSQPLDGVICVARRSLKGNAKFLWSALEVAPTRTTDASTSKGKAKISRRLPDNRRFMTHTP